jgi:hypothetical protein
MAKAKIARMAELVDAHGSGPCALGCGGSSPLPGTINTAVACAKRLGLVFYSCLCQRNYQWCIAFTINTTLATTPNTTIHLSK